MKRFVLSLALFTIIGSCTQHDPLPAVVPVATPNSSVTTAVVPDDGKIRNLSEAIAISSFIRSFYLDKLKYSVDEAVPLFTSKIAGSRGEAITSGSIVVQKNMGVLEEYKVIFETDFNQYNDSGFVIDGIAARYEIYSYTIDGNSISSTSLYVEFEYAGRKIKDTIDISYSFIKATDKSSYTVKNSFNTYAWND